MVLTLSNPKPADPVGPEEFLRRAIAQYDMAEAAMGEMIARMAGDDPVGAGEIKDIARLYMGAVQLVMNARSKLDDSRRDLSLADGGTALDLDAARDRIGRLLDRLRDTGDPDTPS